MAQKRPVTCHACGQQWPRHPALEVACPDCRAPIGRLCRRPSDHGCDVHVSREQLAIDMGVLPLCPKGPTMRARGADLPLFAVPA